MPTYPYSCKRCDIRVIIERPIDRKEETPICISCKSPLVRTYEFGLVSFKGEGFYSTDKEKK